MNVSVTQLQEEVSQLKALLSQSQQRLQEAEEKVSWYERQLFGRKSERHVPPPSSQQLFLGEQFQEVVPKSSDSQTTAVKSYQRGTATKEDPEWNVGNGGLRFDETVPIEEVELPNQATQGLSEDEYEVIGERITERLAQRRSAYYVIRYRQQTIRLKNTRKVVTPEAPDAVVPGSMVDVTLIAGLLIDKFRYHLPLHRQHQRMKSAGVQVSRASLGNWVSQGICLLMPVYLSQIASVLESSVIAMDETPIKVGQKRKGGMKKGYFWPIFGDRQEVVFPFSMSRAAREIKEFLGERAGTLLTDGYAAYVSYAKECEALIHARCWSHVRREFEKSLEVEPERAERALQFIRELYAIEAQIQELELEGPLVVAYRQEHSKLLVDGLVEWAEKQLQQQLLLPSNKFTRAANYLLEREEGLRAFLFDGDLVMDTNHLERTIRPIAVGRKNWNFCWSELGAIEVGIAHSLIETCKLHEIDPYVYFVDVLQRIDTHPMARVRELIPREWKQHFGRNPIPPPVP